MFGWYVFWVQSYTSSAGLWNLRDSEFHPPNVENREFFVEVRDGLKRPWRGMALPVGGVGLVNPDPRCSMYGIFTYIWPKFMVNVGIYK